MYSDASPQDPAGEGQEKEAKESEEPTALIPKSLLAGKDFKPGEEIVLQIVSMHENEVEVKYASEKGEEKGESEMAPPAPQGGGDEMAQMMQ